MGNKSLKQDDIGNTKMENTFTITIPKNLGCNINKKECNILQISFLSYFNLKVETGPCSPLCSIISASTMEKHLGTQETSYI